MGALLHFVFACLLLYLLLCLGMSTFGLMTEANT
jgi:hypothetical protein